MLNKDKIYHFIGGALVAMALGLTAAILVAAGKEAYDRITKKGTPDGADFVSTVVGGLAAIQYVTPLIFSWI